MFELSELQKLKPVTDSRHLHQNKPVHIKPKNAKFNPIMIIISLIIFVFVVLWLVGFSVANDLNVPDADISRIKRVLVVFPHADDESLTTGGLVGALSKHKAHTALVLLTKGEKGTPSAQHKEELKEIRTLEAQSAANILGFNELIQKDFGDGNLVNREHDLFAYFDDLITSFKPDLVITYDLSGLYGHSDHIITSQVITNLILTKFKNIQLWYATFPKKVLLTINLPEHMANSAEFKNQRKAPNLKVFIFPWMLNRIRAVYAHKSQAKSYKDSLPIKWFPRWFFYSMPLFEYFYKVN